MVDFHCFRLKVFGAESEVGMYQVMVLLILYDNHSRFCTDGVILDVMVLKNQIHGLSFLRNPIGL